MSPCRSRSPVLAAAAASLLLAAPAAAGAAEAEPLVDRLPVSTTFADRVGDPVVASAAAAPRQARRDTVAIGTDQGSVRVRFVGGFDRDRKVARTYVRFLETLPHGTELGDLTVALAPPGRVSRLCGGSDGVLACYAPAAELMIVPGREISDGRGPSTSYVVAHEYGHHVAANRDNAPFEAVDYGPKHWASYERVCSHAIDGRLAPGDEGASYRQNPGESWAEVFARLRYPALPWRFTNLLEPDAGALAAARRDVLRPWRQVRTRTFTMPASASEQTFGLTLRLDGALRIEATGRPGSEVGFTVESNGEREGRTRTASSTAQLRWRAACRTDPVEHMEIALRRDAGSGPVQLRVTYAG